MKCFYHIADLDGWCSAAIIRYKFPQCELIGMDYGYEFPWDSIKDNEPVYVVDFSLNPLENMIKLNKIAYLFWIDHHKTSLEFVEKNKLSSVIRNRIDLNKAACELTWEVFFPDKKMPIGVRLLGRYDVWDLTSSPYVLPFQYGMRTYAVDPGQCNDLMFDACWGRIFDYDWEYVTQLINHGEIILKYKTKEERQYCEAYSFETELDGIPAIAVNRGRASSQLFEGVWNPSTHPIAIAYVKGRDYWNVTLYTTEDTGVDVSEIAKKYGGGGHKCAAGIQAENIVFDNGVMKIEPLSSH